MSDFVPGETVEGWYADPQAGPSAGPGAERWWNGVQWTAHTRVPEPTVPPASTVPTVPPEPTVPPAPGPTPPPGPAPLASEELFLSRTTPSGSTELGLPAGVVVRTPYGAVVAPPGPRILAWLLDSAIVYGISLLLSLPLTLVSMAVWSLVDGGEVTLRTSGWPVWATAVIISLGYHALGLSRHGASFGQRTLGLGVRPWQANTRLDGRQVVLRAALVSTTFLGGLIGVLIFGVLALTVATGSTRRGLHEVWSGTCTIHLR